MRHNKAINHLGRQSGHRKAMLANMASSLILKKRITTTVAKAKALKSYVEPLITKSKEDTTHNRRIVFSYLKDKEAVKELFGAIAQKVADRPGGYTRVLHVGFRQGTKPAAKKTTRRSRAKKAEAAPEAAVEAPAEAAAEAPKAPKAPKAKKAEAPAEEAKAE